MKKSSAVLGVAITLLLPLGCSQPPATGPGSADTAAEDALVLPWGGLDLDDVLHLGFEPHSTRLEVEGLLGAAEAASFVVAAHSGDVLLANVLSPEGDLPVRVFRLDTGEALEGASPGPSSWIGVLPASVGYLIRLEPPESETYYALQIEIPRRLDPVGELVVTGIAPAHVPVGYRVHADAGERLALTLASEHGAKLAVHGLEDGHRLVPWTEATDEFVGSARVSQEYLIHVVGSSDPTEFELTVERGGA